MNVGHESTNGNATDLADDFWLNPPRKVRPVPKELGDFLAVLFEGLPGFIELRVIDPEDIEPPKQCFAPTAEIAAQDVLRFREQYPGRNIYHALATRSNGYSGRKKDLHSLRVLWADCDSMGPAQAVQVAAMMGLPEPSIVVASGKGAHLYWLLAEPIDVRDNLEGRIKIAAVESRLRGICKVVIGDYKVTDASHVLRPPKTTNNPGPKKREAGRVAAPVELVSFNPERRYTLADFDAFQAPPRSGAKAVAVEDATWDEWDGWGEEDLRERLRELLARDEVLARYFRREESNGDESSDDYRLGCRAAQHRCSPEEIYQLVAASRRTHVGDPKCERDDYFRRTALACFEEEAPLPARDQFADVEVAPDTYSMPAESGYTPLWDRTESGALKSTRHNANEAVKALGVHPRRDTFRNRVVLSGELSMLERGGFEKVSRVLDDGGARAVGGVAREAWRLELEPGKIHEALDEQADRDRFDSLREHLDSLQWDGTPRLGDWLVKYAGAEDTPLNRATGRVFLLGAVARGLVPGIKFDTMPIFEGPQGAEKSSMLEVIGGEFYLAGLPLRDLNDKDVIGNAQGSWIIELEELANLSRTSINGLKGFLSRRVDRARLSYERIARDFPRRFVFAGTTNDAAYLRDATGNRRFLPVTVGRINLAALRRDRDPLLAEAVAEWRTGAAAQRAKGEPEALALVLPREHWGDAAEQQEARRLRDAWEDPISKWLDELPPERMVVNAADVLTGALHFNFQQRSAQADADARLRRIMSGLGWKYDRRRVPGEGDRRVRGFWRPTR